MTRRKFTEPSVPAMRSMVVTMFLAVIVTFLSGCGGEQATDTSSGEADEQGTTEETAEETGTVSVGEPITVGDVQWTVTAVQQTDILISRFGTEEGHFLILDISFTNNSNQDIRLASPFLPLLDGEGHEFEPDVKRTFYNIEGEKNMFAGPVEPGATKEGRVIYTIPPDASGFKLQVGEAKFASSQTKYIDLGF